MDKYQINYKGKPLYFVKDRDGDYRLDEKLDAVHHTSCGEGEYTYVSQAVNSDLNFEVFWIEEPVATVRDLPPGTVFTGTNECLYLRHKTGVDYIATTDGMRSASREISVYDLDTPLNSSGIRVVGKA